MDKKQRSSKQEAQKTNSNRLCRKRRLATLNNEDGSATTTNSGLLSPASKINGNGECSSSKKTKRSTQGPVFIAVHLGAGNHSFRKQEAYKELCKKACLQAQKILRTGGSAEDAVVAATVILEDSGLVNAGRGSSLTMNKTVEGDAGFMKGNGFFGGVGAVPGVANPVLVAKKIADAHEEVPLLSCGRVPPTYLVGEGARLWAQTQGIPVCPGDKLVSKRASDSYIKYMDLIMTEVEEGTIEEEVNDTVGAIALDRNGNVAAAVSSGGNWLKHVGRVGHAPLFGCGCWASNSNQNGSTQSIAVSSSGSGEMLGKVSLPLKIAKISNKEEHSSLVQTVSTVIQKKFLDNEVLKNHKDQKNVGLIALSWDGRRGEFVWGHTSTNFVVGYTGTTLKKPKMNFSTLPAKSEIGNSLKVEGIFIN